MENKWRNNKGQSILEIILAIGMFTLIASSVVVLYLSSASANLRDIEKLQADMFLQEGFEAVRSMRDYDYNSITNGDHGLTNSNGYWEFLGTLDVSSQYTRVMTVEDVERDDACAIVGSGGEIDSNSKKITGTITWDLEDGNTVSTSAVSYINKWTDWTGCGESSCLDIDSSGAFLTGNDRRLQGINIENTCGEDVVFDKITPNWSTDLIEIFKFGHTWGWRYNDEGTPDGKQSSSTELNIEDITFETGAGEYETNYIEFETARTGDTITLMITMSDGTGRYIEVTPPADNTAPDAITDLATAAITQNSIILNWTAPGDDGGINAATSYDIRYSTSPITEGNWASATQATGEPTPAFAGNTETMSISGLDPNTMYYFAIKASDEIPNEADISNIASATTQVTPGGRISYYDETNKALKFALCDDDCENLANWSDVTIESSDNVGSHTSLGLYYNDPRIVYYYANGKDLKYATCDTDCDQSGNWTTITVDSSGDVGQFTSLAMSENKPRVAYYDEGNKDLKYAFCDSSCTNPSNWTTVTIDSSNDVGQYTSLALDNDKPRITYFDESSKNLKFATCDSNCGSAGNWTTITIDSSGDVGKFSSLAITDSKPRVVYNREDTKVLKYAYCDSSCDQAGNWSSIVVDSSGDVGQHTSLALDDNGNPRVTYIDTSDKDLKFSTCDATCSNPSNWTSITVDSADDVGQYTSLTLDDGKPRLAYYEEGAKDLKYALCDASCDQAGNWTTIMIDSSGDVGTYTSVNSGDSAVTSSESNSLQIDISGLSLAGGDTQITGITLENTGSSNIVIDKMIVTWASRHSSHQIEEIEINGGSKWTGGESSGTELDITDFTFVSGAGAYDIDKIEFNESMHGATVSIAFILSDSSTITIANIEP